MGCAQGTYKGKEEKKEKLHEYLRSLSPPLGPRLREERLNEATLNDHPETPAFKAKRNGKCHFSLILPISSLRVRLLII